VRAFLTLAEKDEDKPAVRPRTSIRKPAPSRFQYRNVLLKFLDVLPALSGKLCPFCKVHRQLPMNLHKDDCTWRQAWELIDSDEPG
jgi:hypothetical protein